MKPSREKSVSASCVWVIRSLTLAEEGISQRIFQAANKMSDEEAKNMIQFSAETGNLKELNRRGWELKGVKPCESIAVSKHVTPIETVF